ncbi:unnamed protein product [Notodromas monacha]|uniref:Uncharacterized protein n=1 Tax=Notodromas monacha TaxID=399045 RepID=A0A7R9GE90_9CRUS|nr:unnamed protein product [Notodromas monacha]CAG0919509.1 unnamed protein product [Notodromas monacha]
MTSKLGDELRAPHRTNPFRKTATFSGKEARSHRTVCSASTVVNQKFTVSLMDGIRAVHQQLKIYKDATLMPTGKNIRRKGQRHLTDPATEKDNET